MPIFYLILYSNQRVGVCHHPASLALAKVSAEDAALHWKGELMLRTSMPIASVGVLYTRLHLSRHLSTVQAQLFDLRGLGKTGEIGLCAGRLKT